jgi:simple sugar transport system permease protein
MASGSTTFQRLLRSISLYLGLVALFIVGAIVSPDFLTLSNQRDVLWQVSSIGILAVGMTLVILTAGIDLSVGSLLSVGSVVCAMLLMEREWTHASRIAIPSGAIVAAVLAGYVTKRLTTRKKWTVSVSRASTGADHLTGSKDHPIFARNGDSPPARNGDGARARNGDIPWSSPVARRLVPLLVGLMVFTGASVLGASRVPHGFGVVGVLLLVPPVGLLLGALSGLIIAKGKLQPFIVTLAMMVSAVGLAKYVAGHGGAVHPIYVGDSATEAVAPASFEKLGDNIPLFGRDLIPVPGLFFVGIAILAWVLLNKLSVGRYIYAVGGNEEAARYSGINTARVKVLVYALSGLLSAVAAVLYCAQYTQGKADAGFTRELDAIAAVVIGGTSLMGGRGSIGGTVVGVLIFGYLSNILNLKGVSSEFQAILKGFIIVLAVLLQEGILTRWIVHAYRRMSGVWQ